MDMEKDEIIAKAKQGDPEAITLLMNKHLQPKGINVEVTLENNYLDIVLAGERLPKKDGAIAFVRQGITKLHPESIKGVNVHARKLGEDTNIWDESFDLESPALEQLAQIDVANSTPTAPTEPASLPVKEQSKLSPDRKPVTYTKKLSSNSPSYKPLLLLLIPVVITFGLVVTINALKPRQPETTALSSQPEATNSPTPQPSSPINTASPNPVSTAATSQSNASDEKTRALKALLQALEEIRLRTNSANTAARRKYQEKKLEIMQRQTEEWRTDYFAQENANLRNAQNELDYSEEQIRILQNASQEYRQAFYTHSQALRYIGLTPETAINEPLENIAIRIRSNTGS